MKKHRIENESKKRREARGQTPADGRTSHANRRRRRSRLALAASVGAASLLMIPAVSFAAPASAKPGTQAGSKPGWARGAGRAGCPGPGPGWRHRGRGRRGGQGMILRAPLKRLKTTLGLSDAQVSKIKALRAKHNPAQMRKLRLQKRRIRAKLHAEFLEAQPNLIKIGVLHNRMQKVRKQMADHRFQVRIAVFKILTPAQRTKLRMGRGRFGRGRGFGRRGRPGRFRRGKGRRGGRSRGRHHRRRHRRGGW